jgi:hypothetical protein
VENNVEISKRFNNTKTNCKPFFGIALLLVPEVLLPSSRTLNLFVGWAESISSSLFKSKK